MIDGIVSAESPNRCRDRYIPRLFLRQLVDFGDDLECVRHVEHVGLALRPTAAFVGVDRPPLVDETPPNHVRLFPVATGRLSLRVPGRRAGLADLIQVTENREHLFALARLFRQYSLLPNEAFAQ